jgi:hypothetical protein
MEQRHYNIEVREWIDNQIAINGGFKFSKYRAKKYKEGVRVYCIRNIKDMTEREQVYYKYIEKIDNQTLKSNEL